MTSEHYELVDRYLDGDVEPVEVDTLAAALDRDQALVDYLAARAALVADLRHLSRRMTKFASAPARSTPPVIRRRLRLFVGALATAAALALAVSVWMFIPSVQEQPPSGGSAATSTGPLGQLTDTRNAVFTDNTEPMTPGGTLTGAPIQLVSGTAQIMFASTTAVDLIGPCTFEMTGPNRGRLIAGTITALVPPSARGFTVDLPNGGRLVDLGTRFTVWTDTAGQVFAQVREGSVRLEGPQITSTVFTAGQSVRLDTAGRMMPLAAYDRQIPLGSLFDDSMGAPLDIAVETDAFQAAAEVGDLGVERVVRGDMAGGPIVNIAPEVALNMRPLGWNRESTDRLPANAAWSNIPGEGGIRTTGRHAPSDLARTENGIGMHANMLVTFDLWAIRRAGLIANDTPLRFVAEHAGANDTSVNRGSLHVAAIAFDEHGQAVGQVDGRAVPLRTASGTIEFASSIPSPLRSAVARFDLSIPPGARYLTLIAASAGYNNSDHAVFSGARLVIEFGADNRSITPAVSTDADAADSTKGNRNREAAASPR